MVVAEVQKVLNLEQVVDQVEEDNLIVQVVQEILPQQVPLKVVQVEQVVVVIQVVAVEELQQ